MNTQERIEAKIRAGLPVAHLDVVNESGNHNVPAGSETHFKAVVVSSEFEGKPLIRRHRMINRVLADELAGGVHALALHTYTPEQWVTINGSAPESPLCRGGMKLEAQAGSEPQVQSEASPGGQARGGAAKSDREAGAGK